MAKIDLKFLDVTSFTFIQIDRGTSYAFQGGKEVINIKIGGFNNNDCYWVNLDKSTAIKFAKTLRTEINKIKEVDNEEN